jgi:hypothetical protein
MVINLTKAQEEALKRLSNQVNLPPDKIAELFVQDGISSYAYTNDGHSSLRESLAESSEASQPEADPELCQRR